MCLSVLGYVHGNVCVSMCLIQCTNVPVGEGCIEYAVECEGWPEFESKFVGWCHFGII